MVDEAEDQEAETDGRDVQGYEGNEVEERFTGVKVGGRPGNCDGEVRVGEGGKAVSHLAVFPPRLREDGVDGVLGLPALQGLLDE